MDFLHNWAPAPAPVVPSIRSHSESMRLDSHLTLGRRSSAMLALGCATFLVVSSCSDSAAPSEIVAARLTIVAGDQQIVS